MSSENTSHGHSERSREVRRSDGDRRGSRSSGRDLDDGYRRRPHSPHRRYERSPRSRRSRSPRSPRYRGTSKRERDYDSEDRYDKRRRLESPRRSQPSETSVKGSEQKELGEVTNQADLDDDGDVTPVRKRWSEDEEEKPVEVAKPPSPTLEIEVPIEFRNPLLALSENAPTFQPPVEESVNDVYVPINLSAVENDIEITGSKESAPARLYREGIHSCRKVENFRQISRLGDGTYGTVYKAEDLETKEIVALKKIKMDKETDGFPLTSVREVRILMQCKHENIVNVKEIVVGSAADEIYVVMEYVEHDLKYLMEDMAQPFSVAEVKCLLQQLLLGMEYLHDNWVLHRDIKSSNLLLNNHGVMKIADFGLARPYGSPLRRYTQPVVTLWYRSPELLLGTKIYSPAIDIWSCACVFAELLAGEAVLQGKSEIEQLDKIFRFLGAPDERRWPELHTLPNAKKFNFARHRVGDKIRDKFPTSRLSELGRELMVKMFEFNPDRRLTATGVLRHPYFEEAPGPKERYLMPSWPSRSDGRKSRKRQPQGSVSPENEQKRLEEREKFMGQRDRDYAGFQIQKPKI